MRLCEGRVAVVTGGGRGLGRAYCLMLAAHGAKVVVNDMGSEANGDGADALPAQKVVDEIRRAGGEAAANVGDVSDWGDAEAMVKQAHDTFGGLDVLVNNAGILRDRMMINMTEQEWDTVTRVHLKGTFAPLHHAANYWRAQHKAGRSVDARIINTTSHSALFANVGQANYASAKAGVATLTQLAARELARYGVTANAIAPRANTRMNEHLKDPSPELVNIRDPDWVAALVTWLASTESASLSGRIFEAWGNGYSVIESWQHGPQTEATKDPTSLGPRILEIASAAKANAGIDRDTWLNP
jgi:NAD(P)-dependent dehydrogenase (short-subunit alcohol dehydrogenase family)